MHGWVFFLGNALSVSLSHLHGETLNYVDQFDVKDTPDISLTSIDAKIDESESDTIDTMAEAIEALIAAGINDRHASRTFFDDAGED